MTRRATLPLILGALVLASLPLQALEYEVHLVNGNIFQTRYEPVVAAFDSNRVQLMTINGNVISLPKDSIKEVISLTEASGFGKRLDAMTILIGFAANDNPTPEEQAALEAAQAAGEMPVPFTNPLVSEPDATGGLPLFFLNQNTPPIGGAGYSGSAANLRRGGSEGGQFVEPQTRD